MSELLSRLEQIQGTLKAPKGQRNSFGNYNYRSCEDILEAVKPLLGDCVLTLSDKMVEVGGRVYVEATATIENGDQRRKVTASAREPDSRKGMDASQITGAASSYARKYALNGLFLIDDTKDADATNQHGRGAATAAVPVDYRPLLESATNEDDLKAKWISIPAAHRPALQDLKDRLKTELKGA
jgi:hypothetical protein